MMNSGTRFEADCAALPQGRQVLIPEATHKLWLEGDLARTTRVLRHFLDGIWPDAREVIR